jgi:hypothetical protein
MREITHPVGCVLDTPRAGTSSGAAGCPDIINIPDNWSENDELG